MIRIAICNDQEKDRDEIYQYFVKYMPLHCYARYSITTYVSCKQFMNDSVLAEMVRDNHMERENAIVILYESKKEINEVLMGEVTFTLEHHGIVNLYCNDIYYFEYINRKVKIITRTDNYICINEKIGDIANQMRKYGFEMSHQSFVVNLYYVEKVGAQNLTMKNGDSVYLAQKRASTIRRRLVEMRKR